MRYTSWEKSQIYNKFKIYFWKSEHRQAFAKQFPNFLKQTAVTGTPPTHEFQTSFTDCRKTWKLMTGFNWSFFVIFFHPPPMIGAIEMLLLTFLATIVLGHPSPHLLTDFIQNKNVCFVFSLVFLFVYLLVFLLVFLFVFALVVSRPPTLLPLTGPAGVLRRPVLHASRL